jgi:plasmid stabilization system protein ParE
MARVELSQAADRDLNDIYIYSYREFGEAKAEAYLHALEQCFEQLAVFPGWAGAFTTFGRAISASPMQATRSFM